MNRKETIKWLESLKAEIGKSEHRSLWHYAEAIDKAIEALEADRPRGEWLKVIDHDGILTEHYVCDKCGMLTADCSNFCPNCGAKMDGERRE